MQFVVVQKRDVSYPLVWWAHRWPLDDLDRDGVFVEVHHPGPATSPPEDRNRDGVAKQQHAKQRHATWFIVSVLQCQREEEKDASASASTSAPAMAKTDWLFPIFCFSNALARRNRWRSIWVAAASVARVDASGRSHSSGPRLRSHR
mmetsp:Transcript_4639/g.12156  ORF Transcript_4639/g.12156 Transcript_4639/m.12156 type:complete len:147 (+) Transcript_4639:228-668(+)